MNTTRGILIGLLVGILIFTSLSTNNRFNTWRDKCIMDGGLTVVTDIKAFTRQWECLKDGKIINHIQ